MPTIDDSLKVFYENKTLLLLFAGAPRRQRQKLNLRLPLNRL